MRGRTYPYCASGPIGTRADRLTAMAHLESKLSSLKGRKFYGAFRVSPEGEEYFACVARVDSDDPGKMGLETGVIPGGVYARRKLLGWSKDLSQLGRVFKEMIEATQFDSSRPELEFYRSQEEVLLFVPVLSRDLAAKSSSTSAST